MSGNIIPGKPGFEEARWFTTADTDSKGVWDVYTGFVDHLDWHKPRPVTLGPKIEAFPDDHPSKAQCLHDRSRPSKIWRKPKDSLLTP